MKIAGVQMDVRLGEPDQNLNRICEWLQKAAAGGAELVIFPECALTGYCFDSRDDALLHAEPENGPRQQQISALCKELNVYAIVGYLEQDGDQLFNAAALLGPQGLVGTYRKIHLPFVGVDRFTDYGDRPFAVDSIPGLNLGMNICYDAGFPEAARSLALQGADLIALPTNWPPGAECMAPAAISTRALENKVYYAAINRVGTEEGVTFIGRSCICGPDGSVLDSADPTEEKMLWGEIDIAQTREKWIIRERDVHEIDRFADRRPEFYTTLIEPHDLISPRERHS